MELSNREMELYPTPFWVTEALLTKEKFIGEIHEPACGDGAIVKALRAHNYDVIGTDLYNHGFGASGQNYLDTQRIVDNVVTNPPFKLANQFVLHALGHTKHKIAMFLRLAFLEGAWRYDNLFHDYPPHRIWVLSERATLYPKDAPRAGTSTTAYGWFVWEPSTTKIKVPTLLGWISPGARHD